MAKRLAVKKKTAAKIQEFAFQQNTSDSGSLTYRCMELPILCDPTHRMFSPSELEFIERIVETLNENFQNEMGLGKAMTQQPLPMKEELDEIATTPADEIGFCAVDGDELDSLIAAARQAIEHRERLDNARSLFAKMAETIDNGDCVLPSEALELLEVLSPPQRGEA